MTKKLMLSIALTALNSTLLPSNAMASYQVEASGSSSCSYWSHEGACEPGFYFARKNALKQARYLCGSLSVVRISDWTTDIATKSDFPAPYEDLIEINRQESAIFQCEA